MNADIAAKTLMKLAESMEALAKSIDDDTDREERQMKTAARRATYDYGTLGDEYAPGGTDPLTRFALGTD